MSDPIQDVTRFAQPKSDQINAEDLLGGPITVQIRGVVHGPPEQPVQIELADRRPWRPCKTTLRLLITAWGADASAWVGRWVTLFRDPTVKWAGEAIGGIRVSHMSHIDRPLSLALSVTKGQRKQWRVEPLVQSFADSLAAMGINPADLDAYCEATGKPIPSAGDEAYRAKVIAAFSRPNGRAGFDAWRAGR